jgi:hypothetical protein
MKITVWLATRDRLTFFTAAEILALAVVLFTVSGSTLLRLVGLVLVAHLGYMAMTSLPMGRVPGRPDGGVARRNLDLRSRVVGFLSEMRRIEDYAQHAEVAGLPREQVEKDLQGAKKKMMAAATEVVKQAGRPSGKKRPTADLHEDSHPTRGRPTHRA